MAPQAQNNEHENEGTLTLPSGYEIPFRVVQPDDASALQRFLERCSERTIYLRFFGSLNDFSEEKAQYFAQVDGVDHFALVALDPDHQDEIISIVRYDREPGGEKAEYAAMVQDDWQDHRVGIDLTRRLIGVALDQGVRCFYAMVMEEHTHAGASSSSGSPRTRVQRGRHQACRDRTLARSGPVVAHVSRTKEGVQSEEGVRE